MDKTAPIAIIPARGGSKRLPRKNVLPIGGKPMLVWPIEACLESGVFQSVIVSTDDDEIAVAAQKAGARIIIRPPETATDTAHESMAYKHVLYTLAAENITPAYFCGIYATAILLESQDFQGAFKKIQTSGADVVMGVSSYDLHPYKALEKAPSGHLKMVHPEWCLQRSQLYPHYVASNGTLYFFRTAAFLKNPSYYPEKLAGYEIEGTRAIDIDTEEDYELAEFMMRYRQRGKT